MIAGTLEVTSAADAEAAVRTAVDRFGRIDVLVSAVPYRVIQTFDCVHQDASSRVLGGSRAKYRRWTHSLTCQTSTASPAKPGGLPVGLVSRRLWASRSRRS